MPTRHSRYTSCSLGQKRTLKSCCFCPRTCFIYWWRMAAYQQCPNQRPPKRTKFLGGCPGTEKRQENGSRLWCLKKCQECGFLDAALPYPDAHRLHFPRSPPSSLFPNARRLHFSQMLTTFTFLRCLPSSLFFLKRLKGMSALINGRL